MKTWLEMGSMTNISTQTFLFYWEFGQSVIQQLTRQQNHFLHQYLFQLYYHRLGDDQSKDDLVAENPEHPKWMT